MRTDQLSVNDKNLHRVLVAVIVVLALLSGLYKVTLDAEQKKYDRLEDMYVRVRDQLGRQKTQELIDASYEK